MALNFGPETALTGEESPHSPASLPAEEIAPHFPELEILKCLGRGGMGVVYKARQKSLDRLVALKLLAPERKRDPQFAQRFAREAQALAVLNHPHIVTVHDFGERDGFFYLLMEYVDGVNLRQLLRARKLSPEEALAIVPPICEALQFAHERGIVHCDIKPENLLLDQAGRVKIADFGIARMLGATAAEEQAAGTPGYMAPEQKETPQRVDSRADIYALGVVFYEMLTGDLPAEKIQIPSRKVQVDVRLDEIVLRALEKSPELRFQTAADLRTQVEAVVNEPSPEDATMDRAEQSGTAVGAALAITWAFSALALVVVVMVVMGRLAGGALGFSALLFVALIAAAFAAIPLARRWMQRQGQHHLRGLRRLLLMVSAGLATVLAIPAMAFALYFAVALLSESGGWHPSVSEAVLVTATVIGAFLLPVAAWRLWHATSPGKLADERSTGSRPWLRFAIALLVVPVAVFLLATVGYLRLVEEEPKRPSPVHSGRAGISAIQGEGHSVYMVQDAERLEYAIYHAGRFDLARSSTRNVTRPDGNWIEEGGLTLQNGRSFGFRRDYEDPETLTINGRSYALREGRLFILENDGSVEQKVAKPGRITPENLPEFVEASGGAADSKATAPRDLRIEVAKKRLAEAREWYEVSRVFDFGSAEDLAEAKREVANAEAELQRLEVTSR